MPNTPEDMNVNRTGLSDRTAPVSFGVIGYLKALLASGVGSAAQGAGAVTAATLRVTIATTDAVQVILSDVYDAVAGALKVRIVDVSGNAVTTNQPVDVYPASTTGDVRSAAASGGIASSTADVVLMSAAGSGIANVLTHIHVSHDALGAVSEYVIKDGSTVKFRGKFQTPANEGQTITFPTPIRSSSNTAINFAMITSVTGGVYVNGGGYTQ